MIGKVWKGSKKILVYALALMMVVGMMQAVPPVQAAESGPDITITSKSYNIADGKMTYTVENKTDKAIKYFVYNYNKYGFMNVDERFKQATESSAKSIDVAVEDDEYITVWFADRSEISMGGGGSTSSLNEQFVGYQTLADSSIVYADTQNLIDWSSNPLSYDTKGIIKFPAVAENSDIKVKYMMHFGNGGIGGNVYGTELTSGAASVQELFTKGTGTYKFYVWAEGDKKRSKTYVIDINYDENSKTKLPQVTNVHWVSGKPGTIAFTAPTNRSNVWGYLLQPYSQNSSISETIVQNEDDIGGEIEVDMSKWMSSGNRTYTVGIRVISKDFSVNTNSAEVLSGVYDPAEASASVEDGIKSTLGNLGIEGVTVPTGSSTEEIINQIAADNTITSTQKEAVAEKLTEKLREKSSTDLKMAIQADENMVDLVEAIENLKGGEPTTATVSNEAKAVFGGTQPSIKVVGAKLNAGSSETPTLELKTPTQETVNKLNFDEKYKKKMVPLEINLTGCTNATNLAIPVSITISVPRGIDMSNLVLLHMKDDGKLDENLTYFKNATDNTITFTVTHFSTFVFTQEDSSGGEGDGSGGGSESTGSSSTSSSSTCSSASAPSGGRQDVAAEAMITVAEAGATVKTKDITTLANSTMKALLKRGDVTLVMEYTYKGVDYVITIPAGAAEDNDIPWYGPLYLAGKYGNGVNIDKADKTDKTDKTADTTYVVKRGDTMKKIAELSGMSLAELAAKNPQIKNLNRIRIGQSINR